MNREPDRTTDHVAEYAEEVDQWKSNNIEHILEQYVYHIDDMQEYPEKIYESVLDDDYQEAEERYCESLTIKDVPEDYIDMLYQQYLEGDVE